MDKKKSKRQPVLSRATVEDWRRVGDFVDRLKPEIPNLDTKQAFMIGVYIGAKFGREIHGEG